MLLVVLCGGLASRLGALTYNRPKILLPINGVPFLHYFVAQHRRNGFRKFVFLVNHLKDPIISELEIVRNRFPDLSLKAIYEGQVRLGTGGAIKSAIEDLEENFFVTYGDSFLAVDETHLEQMQLSSKEFGMTVLVFKNEDQYDTSNITVCRKNSLVLAYDKGGAGVHQYIDAGLIYVNGATTIFSNFPDNVLDLGVVLKHGVDKSYLFAVETNQRFFEIGSIDGLRDLEKHLESEIRCL